MLAHPSSRARLYLRAPAAFGILTWEAAPWSLPLPPGWVELLSPSSLPTLRS